MRSGRASLSAIALLSCVPSILLAALTGMMNISHGDIWGRHNKSFLLLFVIGFALLFVPVATRSQVPRPTSIKQLLRVGTKHLVSGALLGYFASFLAYVGLIITARMSGASRPLGARADVFYPAAVLLLNNYGWLFGIIAFAIFDLMRGLLIRAPGPS